MRREAKKPNQLQAAFLALLLAGCAVPPAVPPGPAVPGAAQLRATTFDALPGWRADDPAPAWEAFRRGCRALGRQPAWQEACAEAAAIPSPEGARRFFESRFLPYQVVAADGSETGLITGYYEPLLRGSRSPAGRYTQPVYGVPEDLLVVELGEAYPELKNLRLRGRLDGRRVLPYWSRADIENGRAPLRGRELLWVDNPLDLFFLQVQGSGRILLESGETVRLGYAEQNGQPYRSVGRVLVERGELTVEEASMQGIRAWAARNPDKVPDLLNQNASYVFFRELPADAPGPIGSLGVALSAGRSLAVDPRAIPQGAPVYLATTWPGAGRPLERLMVAQDTGGAIKGGVRADFFWGFGDEAGEQAGRMREAGRLWVLLPRGQPPEAFRKKP